MADITLVWPDALAVGLAVVAHDVWPEESFAADVTHVCLVHLGPVLRVRPLVHPQCVHLVERLDTRHDKISVNTLKQGMTN